LNDAPCALGVKIQVERASKEDGIANAFKAFAQQHAKRSVSTGTDRQFSGSRKRNRSGYALLRSVSADTDLPIDRSSSA